MKITQGKKKHESEIDRSTWTVNYGAGKTVK